MPHPIENIMKTSIEQIRQIVDVNTIVGDPIFVEKANMIMPVSKVTLGLLSGGGEYGPGCCRPVEKSNAEMDGDGERFAFAGSASAGMSIVPMAFLSLSEGCVKVLPIQYDNVVDRIAGAVPQLITDICAALSCSKKGNENDDKEEEAK